MELQHIALDKLKPSTMNMRYLLSKQAGAPDVSDILPSVRKSGVLVPVIVRPNGDGKSYEIVAGARRYTAAHIVAKENGEIDPLPCAVMKKGDDAAALEASILENCARLDPDPMTQYEAFARLIKEGRSVADIASTFGITELMVERRLALGNLVPGIRKAYRADKIDAQTARLLTMATAKQQREWLKLFDHEVNNAPTGRTLKAWLFGGVDILTGVAIFDLSTYKGNIVPFLFNDDEAYFGDSVAFWKLQNEAIAAMRDTYLSDNWQDVIILDVGKRFCSWEYRETPKLKGGKVYIAVGRDGSVKAHEGFITEKEAKQIDKQAAKAKAAGTDADTSVKAARAEISSVMQNYVGLHRHAAVRDRLTGDPAVALRLTVAHIISGSDLWKTVLVDPQRTRSDLTGESVAKSKAQAAFTKKRAAILALLGLPKHQHTVVGGSRCGSKSAKLFARLLTLSDKEVMKVLAYVMAETLEANTVLVETVGNRLNVDMSAYWQPDEAFFTLLREKPTINAVLREVAGKSIADGNITATGKTQKKIINDCLGGLEGRKQVKGWLPRYMKFPYGSYTKNGGISVKDAWVSVAKLFKAA